MTVEYVEREDQRVLDCPQVGDDKPVEGAYYCSDTDQHQDEAYLYRKVCQDIYLTLF